MRRRKEYEPIMRILLLVILNPRIHGFITTSARSRSRPGPYRIAKSSTSLLNSDETDGWKAGDVYGDLDCLEQAITLANAEQNLLHMERLQLLDHHAQARRPMDDDVSKFVVTPLLLALVLRVLPVPWVGQSLATVSNGQFWTVIVLAPIFLCITKRMVQPPAEPIPEDLQRLAPEYWEFLTTVQYQRPETSCRDSVLVLLEYWASAVAAMAMAGTVRICSRGWMKVAQFLIRIAVVASLYQNPQQVYEVRRPQQPRPMTFFPTLLQPLISNILAWLPFGMALDLYQLLLCFSNEAVLACYSTVLVLGVGLWTRFHRATENGLTRLTSWSIRQRWLYSIATMVIWRRPMISWLTRNGISWVALQAWGTMRPHEGVPIMIKVLTKVLIHVSQGVFLLLVPLLHVRSLLKLVRIVYTHDVSLAAGGAATNPEDWANATSRTKWRYRLEWQEESKRLGQAFREWRDNLGYWFFLEGRVEDQMIKERREKLAENPMSDQQWRLSDRILDEVRQGITVSPSDQWKKNAMDLLAQKHQMDYDLKQFEDPLGVAVQQTLGIGLGFNFDHDTPLKKGQTPSLRRLQARAAKSAIRRVQELYDADAAAKDLAAIADPKQRQAKALELRRKTQQEIETLAQRLTDLVPSDNGPSTEFKDRLLMQRYKKTQPSNFVRVSSHEYRALDPIDAVSLVEHDLETIGKIKSIEECNNESLGSSTVNNEAEGDATTISDARSNSENSSSSSSSPQVNSVDDDEFLTEYLRQQKTGFSNDDDNDNDNDDNTVMKFVLA